MNVLLVEDDEEIGGLVKDYLEEQNYIVDWCLDGRDGLSQAKIYSYNCIILDIHLPSMSGMNLLQTIREIEQESVTPVIMLTARSQIYDKLEGFQYGADDYLTKPFHLQELKARIEAVIRRSSHNPEINLQCGEWDVYPEQMLCQSGKRVVEISNKEMGILVYLLRNVSRTVSAEELLEHVWDREVDLFTETVKTHIKTLRKKIDPHKYYIHTIKGKGYMIPEYVIS